MEAVAPRLPGVQGLLHGRGAGPRLDPLADQDGGQPPEQRHDVLVSPPARDVAHDVAHDAARDVVGDVVDAEQDRAQGPEVGDLLAPRPRERGRGRQAAEGQPASGAASVGEKGGIGTQQTGHIRGGVECGSQDAAAVLRWHARQLM